MARSRDKNAEKKRFCVLRSLPSFSLFRKHSSISLPNSKLLSQSKKLRFASQSYRLYAETFGSEAAPRWSASQPTHRVRRLRFCLTANHRSADDGLTPNIEFPVKNNELQAV